MATARFSRFTDWDGHEGGADISPDGRFVTFIADRDGEFDLWSVQVGTSDFRNLTAGFPPLGPPHRLIRNFGFVGDGSQIWFSVAGDPVLSRKMTVPVSGGTPRPFLPDGLAAPAWSSDGMRLVYFNNALNDALFVADRSAGDPRAVPIETSDLWTGGVARTHSHNMVWSPDDQWLYFTHGSTRALNWTDDMDVWRVRPSGGTPERLTHHDTAVTFLAPIDGRTLIYVACDQDGSGPWLWSLDVVTKITRRITWSIDQYTSVAASRDGKHIVATVVSPTANLWSVPILDRPAEDRDVRRYQVPTVRALAPRFGGNALFYLSSRGAADGLFRFQDGQAIELRKGADGAMFDPPAVSRDGSQVAVVHAKEQRRRLAVLAADGTGFHGLAESLDVQGTIDWSPDGAWIVAGGTDDVQGQGLFKIPVGGGLPVRLVAGRAVNPVWSADGDLIVYAGPLVTGQFAPLVAIRPDNGMAVELPPLQVRPGGHRFLPDGSGLVYLPRTESLDFWLLDLKTRRPRQLTHLVDQGRQSTFEISPAFDITPDGKSIVFDRAREQSDIVLIDLTGK
jgi:Tol biopolymer transport system component